MVERDGGGAQERTGRQGREGKEKTDTNTERNSRRRLARSGES